MRLKYCLVLLINFYQKFLSFDTGLLRVFALGGACRYSPSCSEYTKQVILEKGIVLGLGLGIRRIISCR